MSCCSWLDCPPTVRDHVAGVVEATAALLGRTLVSVCLSGELADGTFDPEHGTIQLIVVVAQPLRRETKRGLVGSYLRRSQPGCQLEVVVVRQTDLATDPSQLPVSLHFDE